MAAELAATGTFKSSVYPTCLFLHGLPQHGDQVFIHIFQHVQNGIDLPHALGRFRFRWLPGFIRRLLHRFDPQIRARFFSIFSQIGMSRQMRQMLKMLTIHIKKLFRVKSSQCENENHRVH